VALCHQVIVTSPSPESPPGLQAARPPTVSAAAAPTATILLMLRLFIIEPLESFDVCVESD
jgi:hypothetical protein